MEAVHGATIFGMGCEWVNRSARDQPGPLYVFIVGTLRWKTATKHECTGQNCYALVIASPLDADWMHMWPHEVAWFQHKHKILLQWSFSFIKGMRLPQRK